MKKLIIFVYFIFVIVLSGCSILDNKEKLNVSKENAITEIRQWMSLNPENFNIEDWDAINSEICEKIILIENATSQKEVTRIMDEFRQWIYFVEINYSIQTSSKMDGEQQFTEGNGTINNPYVIDNKEKFIYFSNCINNKIGTNAYYELSTNIDLTDIEWVPIGISSYRSFNGYFNGNGYEILNCTISSNIKRYAINNVGLFGYNSGVIENLGINNININIEWDYNSKEVTSLYSGTVAGLNKGVIQNCYSYGNIKLNYIGGRIGSVSPVSICSGGISSLNKGVISNSYIKIDMDIKHGDNIGTVKLAGIAIGGKVENCLTIFTKKVDCPLLDNFSDIKEYAIGGAEGSNNYIYSLDNKNYNNLCSLEELNSKEFYIDKLGWNKEKWDLGNIMFNNNNYIDNKYPKLNKN